MSVDGKDPQIHRLLDELRRLLPDCPFQVVDGWDDDPTAVGIAHPDEPGLLVYVASEEITPSKFYAAVERPARPGSDRPEPGASHVDLDIYQLASLVRTHLASWTPKRKRS
jgi:hypothetical protein